MTSRERVRQAPANLMPAQQGSGNDYLMMALSDAKPRTADKPRIDF